MFESSSESLPTSWNACFPQWEHDIRPSAELLKWIGHGPADDDELEFARWVFAQPKHELHVHLEAAVPASFYRSRYKAEAAGAERLPKPLDRVPFETFPDFIRAWVDHTVLIEGPHAFEQMVIEFARLRAAENIVYSEVHISPPDFCYLRQRFLKMKGWDLRTCLRSYLAGAHAARKQYPHITVRFVVDAVWPSLPAEHQMLLEALQDVSLESGARDESGSPFICAVGLGGPEMADRASDIAGFIAGCRELGLRVDIHSGEMTTAANHRQSVRTLKPDRIAHGISGAAEGFFFEGPISMCPLSNILTGSWKQGLENHPIREAMERGLSVSVNSDDPLLFATTLTLEYVALRRALGQGHSLFECTQQAARAAAFAPAVTQTQDAGAGSFGT